MTSNFPESGGAESWTAAGGLAVTVDEDPILLTRTCAVVGSLMSLITSMVYRMVSKVVLAIVISLPSASKSNLVTLISERIKSQ